MQHVLHTGWLSTIMLKAHVPGGQETHLFVCVQTFTYILFLRLYFPKQCLQIFQNCIRLWPRTFLFFSFFFFILVSCLAHGECSWSGFNSVWWIIIFVCVQPSVSNWNATFVIVIAAVLLTVLPVFYIIAGLITDHLFNIQLVFTLLQMHQRVPTVEICPQCFTWLNLVLYILVDIMFKRF